MPVDATFDPSYCHLLATVENGLVAPKLQEIRPQLPTIRLFAGYVSTEVPYGENGRRHVRDAQRSDYHCRG